MSLTETQKRALQTYVGLQTQIEGGDLEDHLQLICDRGYWLRLNPEMSIGAQPDNRAALTFSPAASEGTTDILLTKRGYARLGAFVLQPWIGRLCRVVSRLRQHGWPPVFCFVYDEFWNFLTAAPVSKLIQRRLGSSAAIGSVWLQFVHSSAGSGGYPPLPHAGIEHLTSITFWFSLTDFQVASGCLCLLPGNRVPRAVQRQLGEKAEWKDEQVRLLLQSFCPLPSNSGEIVSFDSSLTHWMTSRESDGSPTMALMVAVNANPGASHAEGLDANEPGLRVPDFSGRLRAIATSLQYHANAQPLLAKYLRLAERLAAI